MVHNADTSCVRAAAAVSCEAVAQRLPPIFMSQVTNPQMLIYPAVLCLIFIFDIVETANFFCLRGSPSNSFVSCKDLHSEVVKKGKQTIFYVISLELRYTIFRFWRKQFSES